MERGYVKLWRISLDKPVFQHPGLWQFACYCLMKATHKPTRVKIGYKTVKLEPGQFVYGRDQAAKDMRSTPQKMRTCIHHMIKDGFLTIKSTNRYSIITIINWELYQPDKTRSTSKTTSKRPAGNQQATTYKNNKHNKNKERDSLTTISSRNCPYQKIADLYHSILPELPTANLDNKLKKQIQARWKADGKLQTLDWWKWYFEGIAQCDFLMGKKTDFAATLYWLTGPTNMSKVLNGQYVNRRPSSPTEAAGDRWLKAMDEKDKGDECRE